MSFLDPILNKINSISINFTEQSNKQYISVGDKIHSNSAYKKVWVIELGFTDAPFYDVNSFEFNELYNNIVSYSTSVPFTFDLANSPNIQKLGFGTTPYITGLVTPILRYSPISGYYNKRR